MALKWGVFGALALAGGAEAAEFETDAGLTLAGAILESDGAAEDEAVVFDAFLGVSAEHLLDNGVELGGALEARIQQESDARPGFAGRLGDCPPGLSDCAAVESGEGLFAPQSPATGLASFGAPLDSAPFGGLEAGYVYVKGGWGEAVVGRDTGVAVRLDARAPNVLGALSVTSSQLDPTGADIVRARNDVSGLGVKASYLTPRIVGVRLGVSYTPKADGRGVDWNAQASGERLAVAEIEDIFEVAASFSRRFRSSGVRLRLGATASYGRDGSPFDAYGDYEGYGFGAEIERDAWRVGGRFLQSNNAWRASDGDYTAVEAGVARELGDWEIGAEYGVAQDAMLNLSGVSWSLGASRKVNETAKFSVGYLASDTDVPRIGESGRIAENARGDGVFVSLSVRK